MTRRYIPGISTYVPRPPMVTIIPGATVEVILHSLERAITETLAIPVQRIAGDMSAMEAQARRNEQALLRLPPLSGVPTIGGIPIHSSEYVRPGGWVLETSRGSFVIGAAVDTEPKSS